MKTKKIQKLDLVRTTVRRLSAEELARIAGGQTSAICLGKTGACYGTGLG
jgi:hypothetical protein